MKLGSTLLKAGAALAVATAAMPAQAAHYVDAGSSLPVGVGGEGFGSVWGQGDAFSSYLPDQGPQFEGSAFLVIDSAVPEPSAWALIIFGFGLVGAAQRQRRSASPRIA